MSKSDRLIRIATGTAFVVGMAALWAGSIYHYGDTSATAARLVADAQAHPSAQIVNAVSSLIQTAAFVFAAIGLASIVRGRGRVFLMAASGMLAIGLPSHALGAGFELTLHELTTSSLSTPAQVAAVDTAMSAENVYFALIMPFLLGLVLLTAAAWRAGVVSWQPFALLLGDMVFGSFVTSGTTPSFWAWWIDPVLTVASFVWLAVGVMRYRPQLTEGSESARADARPLATATS